MKKLLKVVGIILLLMVIVAGTMLGYLTVDEYNPQDEEALEVTGDGTSKIRIGEPVTVMTINTGYGALGSNADFFMDGGKMVQTADEERVKYNLNGIIGAIDEINPDILMLQEIDLNSTRSCFINEVDYIKENSSFQAAGGDNVFAYNYKVSFVPLPVPPIGKVSAGLSTFTVYDMTKATRLKLPCPFTWPLRIMNLKRCLEVMRIPVEDSDKELVLINLHLEAYDDGEGKIAQTKILKDLIEEEIGKGNYVIAGGDFNQTFSNVDISSYPVLDGMWEAGLINVEDFDPSLQFVMNSDLPTCRSLDRVLADVEDKSYDAFQYYVIDGFIVSGNIEIKDTQILDLGFEYTDHNPVCLEVIFK